jgi:competence protein ComEC
MYRFVILLLVILWGYKYYQYKQFTSKNQFITAKIVNQYKKKDYWVLKLKNKNIEFYTTTKDDLKDILNKDVEVGVITKKISFWQYLSKFYAPTFNLGILPIPKYKQYIKNQHTDKYIANIFEALFFGDSLYYSTREKLSTLGISHLFALSGFHLGIISAVLYFLLSPIYRFLPPYRNKNIEIAIFILIILFLYLYFTNFPPSLVRSYLMEIIAFGFAFYLRDIFSFKLLFVVVIVSLVLFPEFITSIGFFMSVMGVFLIFLYFKFIKPSLISGVFLSFYLYIAMFLITHYFFGNFNYYQLLSPFVSLAFAIFYPLEIILHIFKIGGIFDNYISEYLELGIDYIKIYTPTFVFYGYLVFLFVLAKISNKPLYNQTHYIQLK